MTKRTISDAITNISTEYIEKAADYTVTKKARKPVWVKWAAMAACLILVVGVLLGNPATHDGRRVICEYHTNSSGSYATPSPGEVSFTGEVREARKKYDGKKVSFLLAFSMFKDTGEQIVELSEAERIAEYQRLISLGYELYTAECWTYQGKGEKRYYTVVVGYFTESDLSLFRSNPEYGYLFYFATNGDHSGIFVDERNIIADFPTNHS